MDQQMNKTKKIFKAVQAAVKFRNLPFSPRGEKRADVIAHRLRTHHCKGFSGPMIPPEARRRPMSFEYQEPTSPKVSCVGQIKHRKAHLPKELKPAKPMRCGPEVPSLDKKKKESGFRKVFGWGRKTGGLHGRAKAPVPESGPGLVQMRRFASSRDTFANFDWTAAQIAPAEDREYYSDGERGYSDGDDDVIIPFSAPMSAAGAAGGKAGWDLEPRKEINLWKRRAACQPKPLQLNRDEEFWGKM